MTLGLQHSVDFGLSVVNSAPIDFEAALFFGHASDISAFSQMYKALQDSKIAGAGN